MAQCFFCSQNLKNIDYKDTEILRRFISGQGKIVDPRYSSTCAKHQKSLGRAIKKARYLALLPFVGR